MADPVQQVTGGEIPAAVADTPTGGGEQIPPAVNPAPVVVAAPDVVATPEVKPVPDAVKTELTQDDVKEEVKTEPKHIEGTQAAIPSTQTEVASEELKVTKQENGISEPQTEERQSKATEETKEVEIKTEPVTTEAIPAVQNAETQSSIVNGNEGDWQKRESELLKKIEELEKVQNATSEDGLRLELKVREEEIDLLKARVKNLETELQAALSKPGGKNHEIIENIKQQHEELLSKARGMIFDKTKMVKNQELQIQALTTQVQSLKDINQITKDLLEIRNSEVKAMEERFQAMEARYKAEKERYDLVLKRAQTSTNINDDLRKEYETQLAIFKELREKYELRVQALVAENNRLKEAAKGPDAAAPGTSG